MNKLKRVVIMAGGTGGHVFPGLAVAEVMHDNGIEVHWLGTQKGIESRLVPEADIPFHEITISGVRGKRASSLIFAPLHMLRAVFQSYRHLRALKPDVVIGFGGFVSGPGGAAAWLLGLPLVVHEQNAKPGMTNKWLAKVAKRVLQGFPNAFKPAEKVLTVGNPVRAEIEEMSAPENRARGNGQWRLLMMGGSLGAQALNRLLPEALSLLPLDVRPEVVHQTGGKHFESTKMDYDSVGLHVKLVPFLKDMAEAYTWADMVLCRAGALTVSELCAAGVGAILVPYPHAVDDHQTANAQFMVNQSAGLCIQQKMLTPQKLADILRQFAESPAQRAAMAQAAYRSRNLKVAEKIHSICEEMLH